MLLLLFWSTSAQCLTLLVAAMVSRGLAELALHSRSCFHSSASWGGATQDDSLLGLPPTQAWD